jgi:predicted MFS family arabinose efflux permease
MGYILAPALVPPRHCTKASALMVIAYKASHILGLGIAIGLALWLYGDISGAL